MYKISKIVLFFFILTGSLLANYQRVELGNPNAPLVMYDFASMSCIHCATFHKEVLPEIKKNYVDKGLLKIIFMDVPFGGADNLFAHKILYSTKNPEDFFKLSSVILSEQRKWIGNKNYEKIISGYAKILGISDDEIKKVANDDKLSKWLISDAQNNFKLLALQGTPSIIIIKNGDKITEYKAKFVGMTPYNKISKDLDKILNNK